MELLSRGQLRRRQELARRVVRLPKLIQEEKDVAKRGRMVGSLARTERQIRVYYKMDIDSFVDAYLPEHMKRMYL